MNHGIVVSYYIKVAFRANQHMILKATEKHISFKHTLLTQNLVSTSTSEL